MNLPKRTLLPVETQVARWIGLIKCAKVVPLKQRNCWGLLIEGRGFKRMLDAEMLEGPTLLRTIPPGTRLPRTFFSIDHAEREAKMLGLRIEGG